MEKKKSFIINLNPGENLRNQFLKWGLLNNPFHLGALNLVSFSHEQEIVRHLQDGVSLEQARELLKDALTEEAIDVILNGMKEGERRFVTVIEKGDKGEILRKAITKKEQKQIESDLRI